MIRRSIVLSAAAFLLLLACSEGTGPGGPPAIVFMSFGSTTSPYGRDPDIYVMDSLGRHVVNLTHRVGIDVDPAWSPDGRIVFLSNRGANGQSATHIYMINGDGTGLTVIGDTSATEETPSWSPDGRRIAFASNREGGVFQIWLMNPDGSSPVRLTSDAGGNGEPSWSPDGSKIVFASFRDHDVEIYVMNADGSQQTRLTHMLGTYEHWPHWRP